MPTLGFDILDSKLILPVAATIVLGGAALRQVNKCLPLQEIANSIHESLGSNDSIRYDHDPSTDPNDNDSISRDAEAFS